MKAIFFTLCLCLAQLSYADSVEDGMGYINETCNVSTLKEQSKDADIGIEKIGERVSTMAKLFNNLQKTQDFNYLKKYYPAFKQSMTLCVDKAKSKKLANPYDAVVVQLQCELVMYCGLIGTLLF